MQRRTILLYDGVCGLCNRLTRFVWSRDPQGAIAFAPLQSTFAKTLLLAHGHRADELDTFYLVTDMGTENEKLCARSTAAFAVLERLRWPWPMLAWMRVLPGLLTDAGYGVIARNRYRVFGRYDACPLPAPEIRARFIDVA
jgi:predicted DCC family thiol-disulfide oxidoreductase YuxK